MSDIIITEVETGESAFRIEENTVDIAVGQWYWVNPGTDQEWLGCCVTLGSNYLQIDGPALHGSYSERIHFDEFWTKLKLEPNHKPVLLEKVAHHQKRSTEIMDQVRELTARLGLSATTARLGGPAAPVDTGSRALATLSGQDDVGAFKNALIEAKEKTLPELFKMFERENEQLVKWMGAEALTMKAMLSPMRASLKEIDGRIYNISLYAGLTETAVHIKDGAPAGTDEKLHIQQRCLYMDEESLLDYKGGGLEFKGIAAFDEWLARPENMYRLLPHPRTMVGFRVRRNQKQRYSSNILSAFINIQLGESDMFTFFYIRNGDQLWRVICDIEFGDSLFPSQDAFDPTRPMMVKMFCNRIDKKMSRDEYDDLMIKHAHYSALADQWIAENPKEEWEGKSQWSWSIPHRGSGYPDEIKIPNYGHFRPSEWQPMDQTNVYLDDYMDTIRAQFDTYNRIALIIQGLFDRSMVLHPHYPVKTWVPESFERSIKLVYDGDFTLSQGDKPDFAAYRKTLTDQIDEKSLFLGQQVYYERHEAIKENNRRDNDWRSRNEHREEFYSPYGNPGPGELAYASRLMKKARKAVFAWERKRITYDRWGPQGDIPCTLTVPYEHLFNVSAYKPGDFKQFFLDHRTRAEYLKWAPLMLTAEDYYAGKETVGHKSSDYN